MKFSELGVDEILEIINDPDSDRELRAKAIRYLKKLMDMEVEG